MQFIEFSFLIIMTFCTLVVLAFNIFSMVGILVEYKHIDRNDACLGFVHFIQILALSVLLTHWIVKIYNLLDC